MIIRTRVDCSFIPIRVPVSPVEIFSVFVFFVR